MVKFYASKLNKSWHSIGFNFSLIWVLEKIMRLFMVFRASLLFFLFITFSHVGKAQSTVINNVRASLKAGSSKELVKNFNNTIELNFDGEKSSYSRTQAEFVLKDFFKKYPPSDFQYIHQGASKQGLTYVIGKYSFDNGSFRVLLYIKKFDEAYLVDLIDFSRE